MEPIIKVENLAKRYYIGQNVATEGLRHKIERALAVPFARKNYKNEQSDTENEFWALKDISFEVQPGEVVGIIGRNGAGKSTLLKVLSRITEPTQGRITIDGRVASLLEVGTGFHPELTGRENIFLNGAILGMTRKEIKDKFDEIVDFAEVEKFIDTPVKRYSSGMYVRLAFAVAAHLEPEILIVDEVLAVGDIQFQRKCLGKMQDVSQGGRTVLFVSHNMAAVERLCSRGILLRDGRLVSEGQVSHVTNEYLKTVRESMLHIPKVIYGDNLELHDLCFSVDGRDVKLTGTVLSKTIKRLGVGLQLDAISGERIAVLRPAKAALFKETKAGNCEFRVSIKNIMNLLPEGDYTLSLWLSDDGKQSALTLPNAYQLAVPHNDPKNTGHSFNTVEDGFLVLNAEIS